MAWEQQSRVATLSTMGFPLLRNTSEGLGLRETRGSGACPPPPCTVTRMAANSSMIVPWCVIVCIAYHLWVLYHVLFQIQCTATSYTLANPSNSNLMLAACALQQDWRLAIALLCVRARVCSVLGVCLLLLSLYMCMILLLLLATQIRIRSSKSTLLLAEDTGLEGSFQRHSQKAQSLQEMNSLKVLSDPCIAPLHDLSVLQCVLILFADLSLRMEDFMVFIFADA